MTKTFGKLAYGAWGMAILNYVVPTAATAGLLIIFVRTLDGVASGMELWLGWFAAVFFVVSTGHSAKHDAQDDALGIVFDLIETLAMVTAFHALGLVTGTGPVSIGTFYLWVGIYLLTVVVRRWRRARANAAAGNATAQALKNSGAEKIIGFCAAILTVACIVYGAARMMLSWRDPALFDGIAVISLWAALALYLGLALSREAQLP